MTQKSTSAAAPTESLDMKSGIFTYRIKVMFCDIDGNGHVNNKHYNSYCDEAVMRMFDHSGIDLRPLAKSGIGPVIYKAEYEYHSDLRYGDTVKISSTVSFPKKTRAIFEHTLTNETTGTVVCKAKSTGLWIDMKTRKTHRFSDDILEKMLTPPQQERS
jgi:acyl-CoA thioester hydrolase